MHSSCLTRALQRTVSPEFVDADTLAGNATGPSLEIFTYGDERSDASMAFRLNEPPNKR